MFYLKVEYSCTLEPSSSTPRYADDAFLKHHRADAQEYSQWHCLQQQEPGKNTNAYEGDFPGGPVAETPGSHCRGPGFDLWSQNQIPHATAQSLHAITKAWCSQILKNANQQEPKE